MLILTKELNGSQWIHWAAQSEHWLCSGIFHYPLDRPHHLDKSMAYMKIFSLHFKLLLFLVSRTTYKLVMFTWFDQSAFGICMAKCLPSSAGTEAGLMSPLCLCRLCSHPGNYFLLDFIVLFCAGFAVKWMNANILNCCFPDRSCNA